MSHKSVRLEVHECVLSTKMQNVVPSNSQGNYMWMFPEMLILNGYEL
jgi:hypothetical protein